MAPLHRLALALICFTLFDPEYTFPQGAPAEACDSLLPRHAGTQPSPLKESPYVFIASDDTYSYNNPHHIKVEIYGAPFKGFLVAAYDPDSGERIGSWVKGKGTGTLPCSAITHSDGRPKKHVILIWQPPEDVTTEGKVSFVATILHSKSLYYAGHIATVVKENPYYYYY